MFKTIIQSISKFNRNSYYLCSRQCTCWCPDEPTDPMTQMTILHNGVKIATEEIPTPLSCVSLIIAAGAKYETACTNGLTHFIEHIAFKGFKTMDKRKLEEFVNCNCGRLMAKTTREMQIFSMVLPSQYATNAVDKLYRIITDLCLNDAEIEQERCNIALELKDVENDPKQVLFNYLHATAFQGTPLAQRVRGTSENVARFDANLTANFMSEHYQPYRLILATSGNVSHEKMMQQCETRFGAIAPQPVGEPEPGPSRFTGSQVVYRDDSMPLCHAVIAFEAPGYSSPQYYQTLLLKHMMGSWDRSQMLGDGSADMIARGVAKYKICERYESFYIAYSDVGLFGVYFVADKMKVDEVVFYLQNQWMYLCTMTHNMDIERALNRVRFDLAKRYDSVVNSCHDIGKQMLYTCGRKSLEELYASLAKIKIHTVRELADKILYDRCPAVAVMGPTEAMPDYVKIRSGQWWLRL